MKYPTKKQEWRPVEGFESYEVSNWGRVRRWYPDTYGGGIPFASNLAIDRRNMVGLEREKGSGKYLHRSVASLMLAALPPEIMAA